jgi:hypothetical protein
MIAIPLRRIVRVIVVVAIATAVVLGFRAYADGYWPFCCDENKWTGIFLVNGVSYYGHLYDGPGDYVRLFEPYYVVSTQTQPQPNTPVQTQFTLVRRGGGNELHGPEPVMKIARSQILLIEDLRSDSTLVGSIRQLKQGGAAPHPQPAPATTAPTATPSPTR